MTLNIKTKLGLGFGLLLLLVIGMGASGLSSLSASNGRMEDFSTGPFVQVKHLGAMQAEIMNLARALNLALATPDDIGKTAKLKQFQDGTARFEGLLKDYLADLPAAARAQGDQVGDAWRAYLPETARAFDLTRQNTQRRATELMFGEGKAATERFEAALERFAGSLGSNARDLDAARLADGIRQDGAKTGELVTDMILSPDAATDAALTAEFEKRVARVADRLAKLSGAGTGDLGDAVRAAWEALLPIDIEVARLARLHSDAKAAVQVLGPVAATRTRITDLQAALQVKAEDAARASIADNEAGYVATRALLVSLVGVGVFVGVVCAGLIGRSIANPIAGMTGAMGAIAGGDLSIEVPALADRSEIGAMARAVQIFKDNGLRLRATEADALRQQRGAEAERGAHAAARAELERQQQAVVSALASGLDALAKGRLTGRIEEVFAAEYEKLRTDFNAAMDALQDTMTVLAGNAQAISSGTGEISTAADDLSRRTEQQAASLEETAAALDEITATVRRTAESAERARSVVGNARTNAEHSGRVVCQAIAAMSGIESSSREIVQIIGVIDEIAFQTNLLALNAGVEAARAGDAGRGFAVVASEVRALAQRSADAAKEIKSLVSASGAQVAQGVTYVGQTGEALTQMAAQVTEIDGIVGEIAASAKAQAAGLAEVNTAVTQMDQVTQQNAAMVEESTAASQAMVGETAELARLIGRFDLGRAARLPTPARGSPGAPPARSVPSRALRVVGAREAPRKPDAIADAGGWTEF